jgi:hypothetical protein
MPSTPSRVHRTQAMPVMCAWHRRGRLEHYWCRLKLTPRTLVDLAKKPLQEHSRSCKASGVDPRVHWRGLTNWHQQPGGKNVPSACVSICGILTDTPTDARGLLLTQNRHLTPSTQQAARSWLNTRDESWKRASQFSWNWQRNKNN